MYKRQGKIRRLGFSFHDKPAVLRAICAAYPWDFAQLQLNYLCLLYTSLLALANGRLFSRGGTVRAERGRSRKG